MNKIRASTSRNVKTGPFSGSFAKWYFGNNTPFTFKVRFKFYHQPHHIFKTPVVMILTKCDSIFLLLIVYFLLILSYLWEKWGILNIFQEFDAMALIECILILNSWKMMSLYFWKTWSVFLTLPNHLSLRFLSQFGYWDHERLETMHNINIWIFCLGWSRSALIW